MRIVPSKQVTKQLFDSMQRGESRQDSVNHQPDDAPPQGRAIVAVPAPETLEPATPSYRPAVFLAHLIATRDRAPQTRERRRASPQEASATYRDMATLLAQR
ncbi:MAG: hypothetical protein KIT76_07915 [Pseudolabrys sp.]|jgi:hypothetical protein|nr:hypothetical protein [Pseudolabrys sp.]